ncbi:MAG: hypothetical protein RRY23_04330 [Alistipes sp.]
MTRFLSFRCKWLFVIGFVAMLTVFPSEDNPFIYAITILPASLILMYFGGAFDKTQKQ